MSRQPRSPSQSTPYRPVVFFALVLILPCLWLVANGNLSVQTALVRFIGALLVTWIALRLVFATIRSFHRSAAIAEAAAVSGLADATSPAGTAGLGGAGDTGATS